MEGGLRSLSSSSATNSTYLMARNPFPQPPLLPLPAHLLASSPQRPVDPRTKKSPRKPAAASAPIVVVAASPSKKRAAAAGQEEDAAGWTSTEYPMYSVSPPPSSVPMPTSLLLAAASGRKTACAVQVAAGVGGGVDVGATDELRRLLRL